MFFEQLGGIGAALLSPKNVEFEENGVEFRFLYNQVEQRPIAKGLEFVAVAMVGEGDARLLEFGAGGVEDIDRFAGVFPL